MEKKEKYKLNGAQIMENCFTTVGSDVLFNDLSKGLTVSVETSVSAYLENLPTMPDMPEDAVEVTDFERPTYENDIQYRIHSKQEAINDSNCSKSKKNTQKSKTKSSIFLKHVCDEVEENDTLDEQFRCGGCKRKFHTICCLHDHFKVYHHTGGSYHYDDILKTAFPKYDSFCRFTQTEDENFSRDPDCDVSKDNVYTETVDRTVAELKFEGFDSDTEVELGTDYCFDASSPCEKSSNVNITTDCDQQDEKRSKKRKKKDKGNRKKRLKTESDEVPVTKSKRRRGKNRKELDVFDKLTCSTENDRLETIACLSDKSVDSPEKFTPNIDQNTGATHCCEFCNIAFKNNSNLVRHESLKHPEKLSETCPDCGKKFMREKDLNRHRSYAHSLVKAKKESVNSPVSPVGSEESYSKLDELEKLASPVTDSDVIVSVEIKSKGKAAKDQKKQRSKEESLLLKSPYTCESCGHIMPRAKMEIHNRIHTGNS